MSHAACTAQSPTPELCVQGWAEELRHVALAALALAIGVAVAYLVCRATLSQLRRLAHDPGPRAMPLILCPSCGDLQPGWEGDACTECGSASTVEVEPAPPYDDEPWWDDPEDWFPDVDTKPIGVHDLDAFPGANGNGKGYPW